jgi:uncharacterized membrane protein
MKSRIWELDALRGLCILGVIAVHLVYDVTVLYRLVVWTPPALFQFIQRWGGVLFLLISGICVTLGRRPVKRGLLVFCCGLIVTAVTAGMYLLNLSGRGIIIYFGVLHCLGICMLLWPVFSKLPPWALGLLGAAIAALGLYFMHGMRVDSPYLFPLGLMRRDFISSDYFPILPNLGYFLIGACLGKTVYAKKETLLPKANQKNIFIRFFLWCGKMSLPIYLMHQPLIAGIVGLFVLIF